MKRIVVTGSLGQLGSELAPALRARCGVDNVVVTDVRDDAKGELVEGGPFYQLDTRDGKRLAEIVRAHRADTIFHLAALLSATSEADPQRAWDININGLVSVLEVARELGCAVFTPSSIAAFGPQSPKDFTPQTTIQRPSAMYGITKVTGELLCDYYYKRFGVDTRGVRYPGIISNIALP